MKADMDLSTISQELQKRFAAPLPEFYQRRIVVWFDEDLIFCPCSGFLGAGTGQHDRVCAYTVATL